MGITEYQLKQRNTHIGSSDMAAILGISPYANAWDVWAEKTGKVEPRDLSGNQAVLAGNLLEDGVLSYAAQHLGPLTRNQYRSRPDLHLGANVDAIVRANGYPVEAKTAGMTGPLSPDWGEPHTDEVPATHIVQCHVHMLVTDTSVCHLPAFLGGRGFAMYEVPLNDRLAESIAERARAFWQCVERDTPPPDTVPMLDTIRRMRRVPKSIARNLPVTLLEDVEAAKTALHDAKKRKDEAEARLLAALEDHEAGEFTDGRAVTYYEATRSGLDTTALREAYPEIAKQFSTQTPYRTLRVRKKGIAA